MKSQLAAGAIIATSFLAVGASASAQAPLYPPAPPVVVNITLNLSVTIIVINGNFNVSFNGCQVGENVQISFNGRRSIVVCVGGGGAARLMAPATGGTATATLTAPSTPGNYPVTALGLTSGFSETKVLAVLATQAQVDAANGLTAPVEAPAASPAAADTARATAAPLPATGTDNNQTLWIAGSTLLAGLGLAGVGLRRRQHHAAS